MAKCLRADAKLLLSKHTPLYVQCVGDVVEDTFHETRAECASGGFTGDDFKAILMLAAAAALEAEDG
jgi:hypothetical protein